MKKIKDYLELFKTGKHSKKKNTLKYFLVAGSLLLAAVVAKFSGSKVATKVNIPKKSIEDTIENDENIIMIEPNEEVVIDYDDEYEKAINELTNEDEILSEESFKTLVNDFYQILIDNNISVSYENVLKFVSIINIDKLCEENKELASTLFATQSKEEYLNDAAQIIGMSLMYNATLYEENLSTEGFIHISDAIVESEQKDKMIIAENIVDEVVLLSDEELINEKISDFILRLNDPTKDLSYLDNGVGFGMSVNIELLRNVICRNTINEQNFNQLSILGESEKYVSNIFTLYDNCNTETLTLSK